ncbi:MAG: uracil-DNA glycosylase [Deltaproteobacteria bacterium]|nr:uracil-DNA glycosylase [Deltaproteobacteria bacterium]
MGVREIAGFAWANGSCRSSPPSPASPSFNHRENRLHTELGLLADSGGPPVASPVRHETTSSSDKDERAHHLSSLRAEIGDCTRCVLHKGRTNLVFGVGNPNAELMFVGEGPGADEDLQGEPFVGRAGQLLTRMIEAMGLKRGDVYIANIVKCRPPGNRNPEPIEIATCIPFLKKQIDIIQPKVIVCLGKFAAQTLLQTEIPITKLRGEFHDYGEAKIMPTYHPAFLLRNPNMKRAVWEDLKKVMSLLGLKPSTSGRT